MQRTAQRTGPNEHGMSVHLESRRLGAVYYLTPPWSGVSLRGILECNNDITFAQEEEGADEKNAHSNDNTALKWVDRVRGRPQWS